MKAPKTPNTDRPMKKNIMRRVCASRSSPKVARIAADEAAGRTVSRPAARWGYFLATVSTRSTFFENMNTSQATITKLSSAPRTEPI